MRRRLLILIGTPVLLALVIALCWPRGPKEPEYQGKRLTHWVKEARIDELSETKVAEKAIRAIGTNALPWLMSKFTQPEPTWRAAFNRWAGRHPSIRFRFWTSPDRTNSDPRIVLAASNAVRRIDPSALPPRRP